MSADHTVYLSEFSPRPAWLTRWEKIRRGRGRWVVEFVAEATATFFYTFAGTGSTAGYVLGNILGLNLSSVLQVGIAYAVGIVMALTICLTTSHGHANPAFTICAMIAGKCSPTRALRLIVAQIVGAYIACLVIYVQYHNLIEEATAVLVEKGVYDAVMFTVQGPAGIFGLYVTNENLGYVVFNEFVCDFVLALVIFGAIEPTNAFSPPVMAPWIIALTYAVVIWGYSPPGLAANSARDIGGRLAVLTLWGLKASGSRYAAIAALTNIPATLLAGLFYECIFNDSNRTVTSAYLELAAAEKAHQTVIVESIENDDGSSKGSPLPK
ncbi:aquaporin-like protein [Laetiporus sulphureus 93-53]|uniref:Aquaporin-like protein n=1 Tax=Laetiporus sulphureus 93-53 TaxID=1314785 RepID=A0A165DNQ3_9APHY|nr:aquaporin-like protein [Laetiporus sulphureus 93-53]KZT05286.1 aquaporin-like protein [Laetiporus sulphureus 93-53]